MLLGLLCLWIAAVLLIQRWILFPRYVIAAPPAALPAVPGLVRLTVPSPDGPIEGWLLPGRGVSAQSPGPAVIFAHGNAELIDHWPEALAAYRRLGVSVLLPEFRGYGRAPGAPSQQRITDDFVKFHDLLAARPEVDRKRLVYHGRSLGGGVVCSLALRRRPAAMVLMSTFTSITRMARRFLVPSFFVRDPFDNLAVVAELDLPLLLAHGRRDNVVPFSHAEQLHAAAPRSHLLAYDQADHNDCPPSWDAYFDEVEAFLKRAQILR